MKENLEFKEERKKNQENLRNEDTLRQSGKDFIREAEKFKYSYNFDWLSRPIIQYPQDIIAMQELIWQIKPDLILETGIAHGGSLIMSASMLALIDYCEAVEKGTILNPKESKSKVLGIDIDIRAHNRIAIESHPLSHKIEMIQGSSISEEIIKEVYERASGYKRIMVCLDSNHAHEHVLAELESYAPLTSKGSYCCVFDSIIEDMPNEMFVDRDRKSVV